MKESIRRHGINHFMAYFTFTAASSALNFLASLILIRLIQPSEFGKISLFFSVLFFTGPILSIAAEGILPVKRTRETEEEYQLFKSRYISISVCLFIIIEIILGVFFFAGLITEKIFLLIPLYGLFTFLNGIYNTEFVFEKKSYAYGLFIFLTSLTSFLLTIILINVFTPNAFWRIFSMLAAEVIFFAFRSKDKIWQIFDLSFNLKTFKEILYFGAPLLISASAGGWALNESDKIIVAKMTDITSVGYYSAACSIGAIINVFNQAIINSLIPRVYESLKLNQISDFRVTGKYLKQFTMVSVVLSLIFVIAYYFCSSFLLPPKYTASRNIVYFIVISNLTMGMYRIINIVVEYKKITFIKSIGVLLSGVIAVLATIFGIKIFGVLGGAFGSMFGYVFLGTFLWIVIKRME